jgi:LytS/YehU family sensor histidine kinase
VYRYRLRGLDDSVRTTRDTYLSYPTLPSGQYELEITATNKFGVQSAPVHIGFIVEQLLWEKTWFILLTGVLLSGLVWLAVWLRIRQLHRKNAEKMHINHRMAELEQMSLKAQMNPHFIFNSLNSIQKYVMEKDIRGANKFITDFSRLIRLTLEITSKSRISVDEEVRYISNYLELERVRFGDTFQYEITVAPGIDRGNYYIPPMLLQPYVENSIRHGLRYRDDNMGMVRIRFMENASHLICTIEDNGVGRKLAQQYKSQLPIEYQSRGMTLTARRMEMMNQGQSVPIVMDIEDMETGDHLPAGTRITLRFPIQFVKSLKPIL